MAFHGIPSARPRSVPLPGGGGRLEIALNRADWPFDQICSVGARLNPLRPFVFVSKVLGKHWPVKPLVMAEFHRALAAKLGPLEPPAVLIAMAETAIGLGRGVFEAWGGFGGSAHSVFTHTTRYALDRPAAFSVDEPHCHARKHLVYLPEDPDSAELFKSARSLVLIDDEISTGRTLSNLARAFARNPPG